ncbi:MAG: amino acid adenylation domain-containing protein [Myxococcaceae bacterium]|nr:amino acid adenylation domain-containing protein [Myxococcaceae bacterium]
MSLLSLLARRATEAPGRLAYAFEDEGRGRDALTYGQLARRAAAIAARLRETAAPGDTVLLLLPQSLDYIAAFWGCVHAGVIAVPLFPPKRNRVDERLEAVVTDSGARLALTDADTLSGLARRLKDSPRLQELRWLDVQAIDPEATSAPDVDVDPDTIAFLQYTSGSTGTPRGVMVSHRNLLTNLRDVDAGCRHTPESVMVSWLPFFHDMGLIYGILMPVYGGFPCYLMTPAGVMQSPRRWLETISERRATHSGGPNFVYDLCVRAIPPEHRNGIDLSSWTMALNGAEPVRHETLERFAAAFRPQGFDPVAFSPAYGLAEATLKVTSVPVGSPPKTYFVREGGLRRNRLELAGEGENGRVALVGCGTTMIDTRILVVDPETRRPCGPDEVGEIWVAGDTVARGYWRRPEETAAKFQARLAESNEGPFLRTGDLGAFVDGDLVITGRRKDLLILRGWNHYPQDIEATVGACHDALEADAAAAFSIEIDGEERLVVAQEVRRTALRHVDHDEVIAAISGAVTEHHDLQVHAVALLRPKHLPKTSSGKVQRQACRRAFLDGTLDTVATWTRRAPPAAPFEDTAGSGGARASRAARQLEDWIVGHLATALGVDRAVIDVDQPLARYGLGSQEAVRLSAKLAERLGRALPTTLAYDYPTVTALVAHLAAGGGEPQRDAGNDARHRRGKDGDSDDPIAIVGVGCRFPGADGPDELWRLLERGADAVGERPRERDRLAGLAPDAASDAPEVRRGAFLTAIERFDADFFGLSPHEARRMDPQQRLLLEVAWHSLEDAGLAPDRLAGSATGVFVGISGSDYARLQTADPTWVDERAGTGNAGSIAANRISYSLDLRGPSLAVDTACSSSLVAVHLAVASLRAGECERALVGGVNLVLTPHWTIAFSRAGMLAKDGRCKTFDAAADGYVRGEGCGLVVLERLSSARARGAQPLAILRGTAVNQDGRSNGLTAPNRAAQEAVLRRAIADAGLEPRDIDLVEAHGTGTPLGDPIEVRALQNVLGEGRNASRPCAISSVKTNIGHLEAAAGIAGLIKVVLALRHETIPAHLHLERLNEQIALEGTPFDIPTRPRPWPRGDVPRRAGVSSFGFGGTNAHVVVEEAPGDGAEAESTRPDREVHVLPLAAKTAPALAQLARRVHDALGDGASLADVAYSAATGRSPFGERAAVVADSMAAARQALAQLSSGESHRGGVLHRAKAPMRAPEIVFLFTGQGSQYSGMGRQLYDTQPIFRDAVDGCAARLRRQAGIELLPLLFDAASSERLLQTRYAQVAIFALELALVKLWSAWGVEPDAVFGHSAGELAAAHAAGILSAEDALHILAERGRRMQEAPGPGAMRMALTTEAAVRDVLDAVGGELAIAAVNGPEKVAFSGAAEDVARAAEALASGGVTVLDLAADHGFHSPLMAPVVEPLGRLLDQVTFRQPACRVVTGAGGDFLAEGATLDAGYWRRQLLEPVRFADGITRLLGSGHRLFVEIGPTGTLSALARRCPGAGEATWLSSLQQGRGAERTLLEVVAALHVRGVAVDWHAFDRPFRRRRVPLPSYPFQREPFWFEPPRAAPVASVSPARLLSATRGDAPMHTPAPAVSASAPAVETGVSPILRHLLEETSRLLERPVAEIDPRAPFLELGADSIALVHLVRAVQVGYGAKLPVRLLFEEVTCLAALADHLERTTDRRPAAPTAAPAQAPAARPASTALDNGSGLHQPTQPAAPALVPAGATAATPASAALENGGGLHRLMQHQLEAMSALIRQQLDFLAGTPGASAQASPAAAALAPATLAAAAVGSEPAAEDDPPGGDRNPFGMDRFSAPPRKLEPRQKAYIEGLSRRLSARTGTSMRYADEHRRRWADLRMAMTFRLETKAMCYPIVGERSAGARVWDVDGNEYVDLAMGFGVNLFGHNPPFVMEAIRRQLERGVHVGVQSDLAGQVAERVTALTGLERTTFCNSGTEAVMTALRLARAVTGRTRIVQFSGSYHGHSDVTLAVAGGAPDGSGSPMAAGVLSQTARQSLVLPYGEERALRVIEEHLDELAAVLVEPVQSRRPELQPVEFLRRLRELTRRAGVPLIFDEVITGLRSHPKGAQGLFGVDADLATYGKVLGGGLPIGIVAGHPRFLDAVDGGSWRFDDDSVPRAEMTFAAGTFCKHPLAMAASLAVLDHLIAQGPELQADLNRRTAALVERLRAVFAEERAPIAVHDFASIFRFAALENSSYLFQPLEMDLFYYGLIERGVYVWEGRTCFLSTAHTETDLDHLVEAVRGSVRGLRAAGFFADASGAPARRAAATDERPLTEAQQQLATLARMSTGGSSAYNVAGSLELRGALEVGALGAALGDLVRRHEALRTVLSKDGERQRILPSLEVELETTPLDSAAGASAADAWLLAENARPFDLTAGPLLRARLLRQAPERHLLTVVAHHLVVDGWSMDVIVRDLLQLYAARVAGSPAPAAPSMQWRDYLAWQQAEAARPAMAAHEAYWHTLLAGARPDLALPSDHPRPARRSFGGGRVRAETSPELTAAVRAFAKEHGCTLFMTLFAAWTSLLQRVTGQEDLTVGIPASGRPPEATSLVGYCSHLLPIRLDRGIAGTAFTEQLSDIRRRLLTAYEHQDYPFARLLRTLKPDIDPGRSPLLATTFNLERASRPLAIAGLEADLVSAPIAYTGFDLHFNVLDAGDALRLELDVATDLFEVSTARRLLDTFLHWLGALLTAPQRPIDRVDLLAETDRRRILAAWNDTRGEAPQRPVHQLIAEHAERRPDAPAVVTENATLSYGELVARGNQLAHRLIELGVERGERVGLATVRGPEMIIGLLGVFGAGAAYVPLDPTLPAERLDFLVRDAGLRIVLTHEPAAAALPAGDWRTVWLDRDAGTIAALPRTAPERAVGTGDLAYVIYTSGSTGQPKGVMVEHGPIANLVEAQRILFDVRAESQVLQFANFGFDASVSEIFVTLGNGACLHLASAQEIAPGPPLIDTLRRRRITLLTLPPSVLASLPPGDLPDLETVVSAGEACSAAVVERWAKHTRLLNAYGPTEGCVCATGTLLAAEDAGREPSIGGPIRNVRVYVLDRHGEPVPVGVTGELFIGGAQVARGYLGRPAQTAASFVPDPFSGDAGARIYRTGDLARYRADGQIEFVGRRDHQIKLRGFRIEPGEIESRLLCRDGVREALALVRSGQLVAYVTGNDIDVDAARRALREALPRHMVPDHLVVLPAFPLSANGKIDRDRLPDPKSATPSAEQRPPVTLIEQRIAEIWKEVLNTQHVGLDDSFIGLGGHSLLAIQTAGRIEERLGVRVPLEVLFSGKDLESLARDVEALLVHRGDASDLETLLDELEELGEEELAGLLAPKGDAR